MKNLIKGQEFAAGINWITRLGDDSEMMMDFGVLRLRAGQTYEDDTALEKAFDLVYGEVKLAFAGQEVTISRRNCFDDAPWVLHLPQDQAVKITGISEDAEITVSRTDNPRHFEPHLYEPVETPDEFRGAGLMRETSTRIVRTTFNHDNAPYANLVVGEVIGFPGKWSSYPPHHHRQPEIYYYKTMPENGFAYAELGDDVVKVHQNDTALITEGLTHPHVTAPGYALWYLWVIRHIDGDPYITPTFLPEHLWVMEKDAHYWGDK